MHVSNLIFFFSNLYSNLAYFISGRDIFHTHIFYRKVTKYTCMLVDKMSMSRRITFIVCFAIDTRKTTDQSLFRHSFNISINSSSSDFGILHSNLIINILSGEMSTFTGITDDITVLVLSHISIMRKSLRKSIFLLYQFFLYTPFYAYRIPKMEASYSYRTWSWWNSCKYIHMIFRICTKSRKASAHRVGRANQKTWCLMTRQ